MQNETELLYRIARGDEAAFNELYELYWPKVYAYLESIVKSPEASEEMVVDIFVKLWAGREWLEQVQNIGGFLRTSARNKALDFLKTTARRKKMMEAYYTDMLLLSARTVPDQHLLNGESSRIWQEAVSSLSPNRQKVFLMHREEGLSYNEIAERMNISPGTVKKTMSIALDSIRDFLRTHYKDSLAGFLLFIQL
ncbi:MAG: RNA polymerase sigma-70 factor [Candidatus Pseudobacter hemicellulosilyticus]|uniref:RNA polymerase sigma-70 factor n=1 Tax=Candidatus Pseudobacter hemicellulosilyticus TaxID=3121375 RepID=A0AAJ5WUS9_9BACT|nr:MAG: RNA polymerase sigma-70 factor [Pseudobacter sp.]